MILEIDAVIPEDHRLTVELPPEFHTGQHVSVIVNGQPQQKRYEIHPSMVPEREAFYRLLPELLRDHPEQYVAIKGGKVIAIAPTELARVMSLEVVMSEAVSMTYVKPRGPAGIETTYGLSD